MKALKYAVLALVAIGCVGCESPKPAPVHDAIPSRSFDLEGSNRALARMHLKNCMTEEPTWHNDQEDREYVAFCYGALWQYAKTHMPDGYWKGSNEHGTR